MPKIVFPIERAPAEVAEWAKAKLAAVCAERKELENKVDLDATICLQEEFMQAAATNSYQKVALEDFVKSYISPEAAYEIIDGPNWAQRHAENTAPTDPEELKAWMEKQITANH